MAKRNGSNVIGDLNELRIAMSMLEHGFAINALTASDTGWDLHCHVPDGLIRDASGAGTKSWVLSGRTVHIQVKSAAKDKLRVGTVRGWRTGTACGVPTFMFGTYDGDSAFSSPSDLDAWLLTAMTKAEDDATHAYVFDGSTTDHQTRLETHLYSEKRFPSVLQMWVHYPQIASEFTSLTAWMNHDPSSVDPRDEIIEQLAIAIWANAGYGRHTQDPILVSSLASLYKAAGFENTVERAEEYLRNGIVHSMTHGDHRFTRDSISFAIARFIDNQTPQESAVGLLEHLAELHTTCASRP